MITCITEDTNNLFQFVSGLSNGLIGSWSYPDAPCVAKGNEVVTGIYDIYQVFIDAFVNKTKNVLDPFYIISDWLITLSNYQIACLVEEQAVQYETRVNSDTGYADLVYTIVNVPVEGFFEGKNNAAINNILWDVINAIYKDSVNRKSMTCKDLGFHVGEATSKILNFEAPTALYYNDVAA